MNQPQLKWAIGLTRVAVAFPRQRRYSFAFRCQSLSIRRETARNFGELPLLVHSLLVLPGGRGSGYRDGDGFRHKQRGAIKVLCPQPVNATASANALDGVIHPSVCRGRVLSERAMASSSRWVHWERSADLGKY